MKISLRQLVALPILASMIIAGPVQAQSSKSREATEQMFANIAKNTQWDMSKNMLWGYFFTHPSRQPLELASQELSRQGYRVVKIYLSDKEHAADPDLWWLHVERVEVHSVTSLFKREAVLTAFAKQHGLGSYDGMDVGPVSATGK